MKILVIHEVPYLKKPVYEYQDFAERLASLGHQVSVFDFDQTGSGEKRTTRVSKTCLAEVELTNTGFIKLPVLSYLSGRRNAGLMLDEALMSKKFDVVFLYSVFINGTNTVRICRDHGIPVVYRILDIYHKVRQSIAIQIPLYFGEKYIYRNADVICLTNERMKGYLDTMTAPTTAKKVEIVHHGVDTTHFKPQPRHLPSMEKWGIKQIDKVALFLGTTYSFSGLDVLLKATKEISAKVPHFKLVVVGAGELDNSLQEIIKAQGLQDHVVLTGMRPYAEVADLISMADLTLTPFYINDITREIVPIKMFQYLACGKPVLCAPIPDVMRLLPESVSGIIYRPIEESEKFISTCIDLLNSPDRLRELGKSGLEFVKNNFSVDVQIQAVEAMLQRAIAEKTRQKSSSLETIERVESR